MRCEHPSCNDRASYRAPKGRLWPNQYHLFCLKHVKEYNSVYNHFDGLKPPEANRVEFVDSPPPIWKKNGKRHEPFIGGCRVVHDLSDDERRAQERHEKQSKAL